MNVQIPIAGTTLTGGETYSGQLPVWATRPLMIRIKPDFISGNEYPAYIQVVDGGGVKKLVTLPFQEELDVDLSFAAPLLTRADRNKSQGDPAFPQQLVNIWSSDTNVKVVLPVFHCDETYWDTLGVDSALPQPPKPRIPGQVLDIYFPYRINPLDAFQVEVEPVTGAPSSAIFPTTYVLGNTIDIRYIKKLTIKNVWGSGMDQVINYEDKLHNEAVYDKSLQCALSARWNMRNGQWFWAAFKDYFWSNKFTAIRGRGGVTEQAEITINLEYGEEWYNVYQELLVSSNIVFDLDIPGINQYQSKRFRAEVSGDTGARWSNSTRTYRQQVRFRTTELQDNYMFPLAPDQPPTPAIAFSAQHNPWTIGSVYAEGLVNNIYSNAAWEVQSTPSWISADSLTGTAGTAPLAITVSANTGEARTGNIVLKSLAGSTTYNVAVTQAKATGSITVDTSTFNVDYVTLPVTVDVTSVGAWSVSQRDTWITPSVTTGANGTTTVKLTIADNMRTDPRTGTITFHNDLTGNIAVVTVNQGDVPSSIGVYPSRMSEDKSGTGAVVPGVVSSDDNWTMGGAPSWVAVSPTSGEAGQTDIEVKYDTPNNTGAKRSGYLRLENMTTREIAICIIEQAGATGNISVDTSTFNVDYVTLPVTVGVTSVGAWSVSQRDTWITPDAYEGAHGETTVTLTIADNMRTDPRTGTITFHNDLTGNIAVVTVNQGDVPSSIGVYPSRMSEDKSGTGAVVPGVVSSDDNWTMGGAPSWVAVSPTSGEAGQTDIEVKYDTPNNTGAKRSGYLRLENMTTREIAICIIEQAGATGNISVDTSTFNVDYVTLPVTVGVTSVGAWSVSQRDTWITPDAYEGAHGETTVTLTIADNMRTDPRTGTITFHNDLTGNIAVVTVNQGDVPSSIGVYPSRMSEDKSGTGAVVPGVVSSDDNWTMGGAPSWVAVSPTSGEAGQTDIEVKYDTPNNTGAKRSGYLRLENMTTREIAICIIEQAGATGNISVDTSTFNVDYVTLPVTVGVTSVGAWSVSQRDTWITPDAYEGAHGETTVTLTIADNMRTDPRTGTITFHNDLTGNIAVVTVNQGGVPSSIGVYPSRMSEDKSGTGAVVPGVVSSDDNWTMGGAPSWVAVSPTSGEAGQTDIEVKYDTPNNTGAKRSGYLRLENMTTREIAICIIEQLG